MTTATRIRLLQYLAAILMCAPVGAAGAARPVFTYQGQLKFEGAPINGDCDMMFKLFDSLDAAGPIDSTRKDNVPVKTGLFTVQVDFEADNFTGADRWLEVAASCPAGSEDFKTFTPRQPVTTVPYAIRAMTASALDAPGGGPGNSLIVDEAGRVGIGTASAGLSLTSRLSIAGQDGLNLIGTQPFLTLTDVAVDPNDPTRRIEHPTRIQGIGGGLVLSTESAVNGTDSSRFMVLDSAGNVGIGVLPPTSRLDVAGDATVRGKMFFGNDFKQVLNLFGQDYGIGIQTADLYFRSGGGFAWHVGGSHNPDTYQSGGGTTLMTLDETRGLNFGARFGPHLSLWTDEPQSRRFGIGMQASTLYFRTGNGIGDAFVWYKGGGHDNGQRQPGAGGIALMTLDSETGLVVNNRTTTKVLEISGGGDLAEPFRIAPPPGRAAIEPGMVVVIDPDHPGELALSRNAYDRRVAGVISGAHGLSPGMIMAARGDAAADGDHPVALTGRVWTRCDATESAIEPGDLLTTSSTPGHARKATDYARAPGAVLGKAMTRLARGETGLVLTLVSLQ